MTKRKESKTATAVALLDSEPIDELLALAIAQEDAGSFLELYAPVDGEPLSPTGDTAAVQEPSPASASPADGDRTSPETASQSPSPEAAVGSTAPGLDNRGDTWIDEESGPPVLAAPSREETFVVHGQLPWRDSSTMERLPGFGFRLIETPVIEPPSHLNMPRHIDVNGLTAAQARAWRQLFLGLEKSGSRLSNGRRVTTSPDAIRWLLEQLF